MNVRLALSVQPYDDLRRATVPLFASGAVDAVEWSWEAGTPEWLSALVGFYAQHDALYTHLVGFPVIGEGASLDRKLAEVARRAKQTTFRHVTAHFGLVDARGFEDMAPLPPVPTSDLVATGRERLARLREAAGCPVGLENLALAFSTDDVARQGDLLDAILPRDAFLLLDLHNLYCQAVTFEKDPASLLESYPLERVREIHVSGGRVTYPSADGRPFRRDTHDGRVPDEVLDLLDTARARCPSLEMVCLERIGGSLASAESARELADDFERVRTRLAAPVDEPLEPPRSIRPRELALPVVEPRTLRVFESELVALLVREKTVEGARNALARLASHPVLGAYVDRLEPRCLSVAMELEKKWARRVGAASRESEGAEHAREDG